MGNTDMSSPAPVTLVNLVNRTTSVSELAALLKSYAAEDDVLTSSYYGTVIVTGSVETTLSVDCWTSLEGLGVKKVIIGKGVQAHLPKDGMAVSYQSSVQPGTSGPFLAITKDHTTSLFPVYRLEHDMYRNFLFGAYPEGGSQGKYIPFDRVFTELGDPWIPIPSRLHSAVPKGPLAGKRFAVKGKSETASLEAQSLPILDLYNINGLITAGGSRAYADIYGTATVTASSVQRLLDLGAVVVGKVKTAQFASGADTNDATAEYQYPFSPRSDGWQTCGASSSGSGCSVASYDWLDFAIGTDTGGSVRVPAAMSGIYGMRPTVGAISLDHVLPLSTTFDTGGVLARDPEEWTKIVKLWYGASPLNLTSYPSFPKKMIIPTNYYPWGSTGGIAIGEEFIKKMQDHFGMERVELDFNDVATKAGQNVSLVAPTVSNINKWFQYSTVGKPLIEAWGASHGGRFPPMDLSRRTNFRFSAVNLTEKLYEKDLATIHAYRQWFDKDFLPFNAETCSESIVVYDVGPGGYPAYREASLLKFNVSSQSYPTPRTVNPGEIIDKGNWSPAVGIPDMTIPVGQTPFNSSISLIEEQHPVTLNIAAAKGCDFMLLDMVNSMAKAGLLTTVKTGTTPF